MYKKDVLLICGGKETEKTLMNQLKEYLSQITNLKSLIIDEGIDIIPDSNLIILSSQIVHDELCDLGYRFDVEKCIIAERTLNYEFIDPLVLLPAGTKVIFVSDADRATKEGIAALKEIGLDHIDYIPYYSDRAQDINGINIAITPGDSNMVPKGIETIYDIGPRIIDFSTIISIMKSLNMSGNIYSSFSNRYLSKIISISKKVVRYSNKIKALNSQLSIVIDSMNDGILVYDIFGNISFANENLKKMFKINFSNLKDKAVKDIFHNSQLISYLMDKKSTEDCIINIEGIEVVFSKFLIFTDTSYIAIFRSLKETLEYNNKIKKYIKKGYFAKYTFEDIIGKSVKINNLKDTANKLAKTDLTILIEGESGTGKELFASAIHNESKRCDGPYLALNLSSLSDELIESELFGYEEGAFTGAKKGGKQGLFEQCDGGTIFLDEIGDISTKVQARLLRVLDSKEVMRVGGSEIINVDVRVIAATNKDLLQLVKENAFREDLYYRLKMGYLRLIPLRERKDDVEELLFSFINRETAEEITIDKEALDVLMSHNWLGNIRELRNTVSYMMAVKEGKRINLSHLPDRSFFNSESDKTLNRKNSLLNETEFQILKIISRYVEKGEIIGRQKIYENLLKGSNKISMYKLRFILKSLEDRGMIVIKRGRGGTVITDHGIDLLMN